jgi:pimeloyl-ACP methyl ester carboxylesterase
MSRKSGIETQWLTQKYPEQRSFNETYGYAGSHGMVHIEAMLMRRRDRPSRTLFFFMHPATPMDVLPVPHSLVALGQHVLCARSRYFRNDPVLIFEKVLLDFGAWVRYAKEVLGYEKIVIVGWSGGGPLAVFYQSQAQNPTITATPAGDPVDVVGARLIPGDAVIFQGASVSRARLLLEALDPSIRDEVNPDDRDPRMDLYNPANPAQPPFSAEFIAEFRHAQRVRMDRITSWVKGTLEDLRARKTDEMERCFVVHRTMADPRFIDPSIDPNDRRANWCLSGKPETVNSGPVGFARFSSLRSFLSQWSIDDSKADATLCSRHVTVPFLSIENTADDGAPPSHMREVFDACMSTTKQYAQIKGANHYYAGQPELVTEASYVTLRYLAKHNLCEL